MVAKSEHGLINFGISVCVTRHADTVLFRPNVLSHVTAEKKARF